MIPIFVWYALLGASVREAWGIWRAYETFLSVKLVWKRILITWIFAWFFGIVGGEILLIFGIFSLGINLAAFFSGILSGNSINYFAKKNFSGHLVELFLEKNPNPNQNIRRAFTRLLHDNNLHSELCSEKLHYTNVSISTL